MKIKAIVIDLDGTAIDSPRLHVPSPAVIAAVKKAEAAGIKICVATGRATSGTRQVLIDLATKDPAIISGGSRIINPISGEELWGVDIAEDSLKQVLSLIEHKNYNLLWNDFSAEDYMGGAWPKDRLQSTKDIYFFEICYVPEGEVKELTESLEQVPGIAVVRSHAWKEGCIDLHIMNSGATKEHSIYELQKMLGIKKEEMIGVGDGLNDIHLFHAVGYKVAMGNAGQELKDAADEVIGDVSNDGLAEFIEKLVSNGGEV